MRREDEKQKVQAKVLVAALKEVQRQEQASGEVGKLEINPIHIIIENSEDPIQVKHLIGQALEHLLTQFTPKAGTKLLQYVDDLLIAGSSEESVRECTVELLNFIGDKGLKVSKSKLQFTEPEVKYLGHWLSQGKKKLDPERVARIIALPTPKTKRQIRQVLGLLRYCRQWIEGFSEKVKFLYERLNSDRVKWTEQNELDFQKLKEVLMTAPVLTLPDVNKEFQLFVDVSGQTAQGVLTQEWASKRKPIGFLSKILDPVSQGWPTCLQAIVAVALLVEEWEERIDGKSGKAIYYIPAKVVMGIHLRVYQCYL
ncbi:hypothetical protein HGM15179_017135 [Zosterops borbonicus]|uniref:ribonuclease H n=2 Tax=Zosterops borbonicus TaxID=364589 RepID=A0A8K1G1I7_9PASS|nr:hypothetical protein HGM15179_017135 [Zosterops borbonicus]